MDKELIRIIKAVDCHMQFKHHVPLYMIDITDSKGYWRNKNKCNPATCGSPLHGCIGNEDGIHHTMTYYDNYRGADGRFKSIYSSWKLIKQATDDGILTDKIIENIVNEDKI